MQPLVITAHLMSGFASSDPWSPAIDGVLAYRHMMDMLGPDEFAINCARRDLQQPVTGLPLAVETWGDWWWYQCSAPIYKTHAVHIHHLHRRFDAAQAEQWWGSGTKSGKVLVAAGPYKNARKPLMQHITPMVQWAAVGERTEIERLPSRVTHVGARVGSGFGRVRRWDVTDCDNPDLARWHRPLPTDHEMAAQLDGPRMYWGVRPPGRHPENITECAMPMHSESL